jgi:hypothetical protein
MPPVGAGVLCGIGDVENVSGSFYLAKASYEDHFAVPSAQHLKFLRSIFECKNSFSFHNITRSSLCGFVFFPEPRRIASRTVLKLYPARIPMSSNSCFTSIMHIWYSVSMSLTPMTREIRIGPEVVVPLLRVEDVEGLLAEQYNVHGVRVDAVCEAPSQGSQRFAKVAYVAE